MVRIDAMFGFDAAGRECETTIGQTVRNWAFDVSEDRTILPLMH